MLEEIINALELAGFDVAPAYPYLLVRLNRRVGSAEVQTALDNANIAREAYGLSQRSNAVTIWVK